MRNAIAARDLGDDYQRMVFWKYVNQMMKKDSDISWIGYECDEVKSFDDIVICYEKEQRFRDGFINRDYVQVKFHIRNDNYFTLDNLISPKFINANVNSILNNVVKAYENGSIDFSKSRFIIYSPWDIKQDDVLYGLISNEDGSFELDKIFDGTTSRSKMGKIRNKLCQALDVDESDLYAILKQTCIYYKREGIEQLEEILNREFSYNGLRQWTSSRDTNPYIDLIRKCNICGIHEFIPENIMLECEREGLIKPSDDEDVIFFRSFDKYTEETDSKKLDLLSMFNGRFLIDGYTWDDIYSLIDEFVKKNMKIGCDYKVRLDVHLSIAFALGRVLNTKSGIKAVPIQKTFDGLVEWGWHDNQSANYDSFIISESKINSTGKDIAVVISVTNDIHEDVNNYISACSLDVGTIYYLNLPNISNNSLENGYHAWLLAEQINDLIGRELKFKKKNVLHLFASCPVTLMFNIGKMSLSYGKVQLYEFDFKKEKTGTYYKTLLFPQRGEC